jgi:hypothetical protein
MTNVSSDRMPLAFPFHLEVPSSPAESGLAELLEPEPCRPQMQVGVREARQSFVELPALTKKASRRWIWDLSMMVVGALVGIYFGSATVRGYATRAVHGQLTAPAALTADASSIVTVNVVQRPLTPDLNRTAAGATTMDDATPPTKTNASTSARGRRAGSRK